MILRSFCSSLFIMLQWTACWKSVESPFWPCGPAFSAVVSLITLGTMGSVVSIQFWGYIFTTWRSLEKAAVSEDFSRLLLYLLSCNVAKHPVWNYVWEKNHADMFSIHSSLFSVSNTRWLSFAQVCWVGACQSLWHFNRILSMSDQIVVTKLLTRDNIYGKKNEIPFIPVQEEERNIVFLAVYYVSAVLDDTGFCSIKVLFYRMKHLYDPSKLITLGGGCAFLGKWNVHQWGCSFHVKITVRKKVKGKVG